MVYERKKIKGGKERRGESNSFCGSPLFQPPLSHGRNGATSLYVRLCRFGRLLFLPLIHTDWGGQPRKVLSNVAAFPIRVSRQMDRHIYVYKLYISKISNNEIFDVYIY